jgi:hypothetical protein
VLGKKVKRLGRQIAATGEKDPVENLDTVARRHSRENVKRERSFVVTIQVDRLKAFSIQYLA